MTKAEIAELISLEVGLTKKQVSDVVDLFFEKIKLNLSHGDSIEMRGFGTFGYKVRNARVARNPRTNEEVQVPERAVVYFKPGKELKEIAAVAPIDKIKKNFQSKKRV